MRNNISSMEIYHNYDRDLKNTSNPVLHLHNTKQKHKRVNAKTAASQSKFFKQSKTAGDFGIDQITFACLRP